MNELAYIAHKLNLLFHPICLQNVQINNLAALGSPATLNLQFFDSDTYNLVYHLPYPQHCIDLHFAFAVPLQTKKYSDIV